ncbi:hypothetical protein RE628_13465 [Paenibacillus sp. D2_2]|uniref:hypothetical protein n=1 Tax=Paenibacillus sp. D2_2 TaxID=3073092 RepID=UPI002815BAEB|nr:hypothetical protein [Paenibacillus sp. D2_2]WMT43179.1 hypothetical protein RE628_13465 [Paenibacillus sp. D2_2]
MEAKLSSEESALIMQSVQDFLSKIRRECEDSSDKEFLSQQIKVAQSVFEQVLDLRLSDDGKTISTIGEVPVRDLAFKANYTYHGRDKITRTGSIVVEVSHKAFVKQAVKDRLHKDRGWEQGWIFVGSIEQVDNMDGAK